jgi:hypothetical protein
VSIESARWYAFTIARSSSPISLRQLACAYAAVWNWGFSYKHCPYILAASLNFISVWSCWAFRNSSRASSLTAWIERVYLESVPLDSLLRVSTLLERWGSDLNLWSCNSLKILFGVKWSLERSGEICLIKALCLCDVRLLRGDITGESGSGSGSSLNVLFCSKFREAKLTLDGADFIIEPEKQGL